MSRKPLIPEAVTEAARTRAEARRTQDWATADRLRAEIEAAGWRVVDRGTDFRLEPMHPPDVTGAGATRYGRSEAVPSRLDEPATGAATIVVVVSDGGAGDAVGGLERSLGGALEHTREGVDAVVAADGLDEAATEQVRAVIERFAPGNRAVELVETSAPLGHAASLNAGIRRCRGEIVVVLDASLEPQGDVVGPLAGALADPSVAVAGPFGLVSADLRRFEEIVALGEPVDAAAIEGYLMAFRRSDATSRGPLDERFRYYRNLDIWWSLVLRDEGEASPPRRALVVPDLPIRRGVPRAWSGTPEGERERLSKRNFYRLLDRFRARPDLAVPPPAG